MEKLHVSFITEILGRPAEHVKEALQNLMEKFGTEKGVKILNKQFHDPAPIKDSKDLFTAFAEIEAEFDSLDNYFGTIFAYTPSHIEIIKPEKLSLSNAELNDLGNTLLQRLHNYEAITKKALADAQILNNKLQEVAPHLFKQKEPEKEEVKKEGKKGKKKKSKTIK